MALDDRLEKLKQAEEWLATEARGTEKYLAAMEHLFAHDVVAASKYVSKILVKDAVADVAKIVMQQIVTELLHEVHLKGCVPVTKVRVEQTETDRVIKIDAFVPVRKVTV